MRGTGGRERGREEPRKAATTKAKDGDETQEERRVGHLREYASLDRQTNRGSILAEIWKISPAKHVDVKTGGDRERAARG